MSIKRTLKVTRRVFELIVMTSVYFLWVLELKFDLSLVVQL